MATPRAPRPSSSSRSSAIILVDIVHNGVPHLSMAFLTEAPREGMTAGGIFPAHRRHGRDGLPHDARGRARGRRDGDLPARVRARQLPPHAAHPHRRREPRGRAVDRLRPVRAGLLRAVPRRGHRQGVLRRREGLRPAGAPLGGAHDGRAHAARRDRGHRGGAARRAARAARGVARARRDEAPDRRPRRRAAGERRHPHGHDPRRLARRGRGRAHPLHGRRLLPAAPAQGLVVAVHDAELPRLRARDAVARRRRHEAHPLQHGARAARADLRPQHRRPSSCARACADRAASRTDMSP